MECEICRARGMVHPVPSQEEANFHHLVESGAAEIRRISTRTALDTDVLSEAAAALDNATAKYKRGDFNAYPSAGRDIALAVELISNARTVWETNKRPAPHLTEAFGVVLDLYAMAYPVDYYIHDLGVRQLKAWRRMDYVPTNVPDKDLDEIESELAGEKYEAHDNLIEARAEDEEPPGLPPISMPPTPYKAKPKRKSRKPKAVRPQKDDETPL